MQPKTEWTLQRITELASLGGRSTNPNALFVRIAALAEEVIQTEQRSAISGGFGVRLGGAGFAEGTAEIRSLDGDVLWRLDP